MQIKHRCAARRKDKYNNYKHCKITVCRTIPLPPSYLHSNFWMLGLVLHVTRTLTEACDVTSTFVIRPTASFAVSAWKNEEIDSERRMRIIRWLCTVVSYRDCRADRIRSVNDVLSCAWWARKMRYLNVENKEIYASPSRRAGANNARRFFFPSLPFPQSDAYFCGAFSLSHAVLPSLST